MNKQRARQSEQGRRAWAKAGTCTWMYQVSGIRFRCPGHRVICSRLHHTPKTHPSELHAPKPRGVEASTWKEPTAGRRCKPVQPSCRQLVPPWPSTRLPERSQKAIEAFQAHLSVALEIDCQVLPWYVDCHPQLQLLLKPSPWFCLFAMPLPTREHHHPPPTIHRHHQPSPIIHVSSGLPGR